MAYSDAMFWLCCVCICNLLASAMQDFFFEVNERKVNKSIIFLDFFFFHSESINKRSRFDE